MFLCTDNTIVNLNSTAKVQARPYNGDNKNKDWEVIIVYQDTRSIDSQGDLVWTGTYDSVMIGSQADCENVIRNITDRLGKNLIVKANDLI